MATLNCYYPGYPVKFLGICRKSTPLDKYGLGEGVTLPYVNRCRGFLANAPGLKLKCHLFSTPFFPLTPFFLPTPILFPSPSLQQRLSRRRSSPSFASALFSRRPLLSSTLPLILSDALNFLPTPRLFLITIDLRRNPILVLVHHMTHTNLRAVYCVRVVLSYIKFYYTCSMGGYQHFR